MLWYKSWLETRWRFLIGLAILILSAVGTVLAYPRVVNAAAAGAGRVDASGEVGRPHQGNRGAVAHLSRLHLGAVAAPEHDADVVAVRGRCSAPAACSRRRPAAARCSRCRCRSRAIGCSASAPRPGWPSCWRSPFVPSLLLPLLSPAVGQTYSLVDALVHGTVRLRRRRGALQPRLPAVDRVPRRHGGRSLIVCLFAACARASSNRSSASSRATACSGSMDGEIYFRGGGLPWLGLLASAAVSAALLFAASRNLARQDF